MAFELPPLPYSKGALAPHMSEETLEYHHGKHHATYVKTLNGLIEGTDQASASLDDIIKTSKGKLFNQAAQHWNHSFFWNCLTPNGGGPPTGAAGDAITSKWGSFDKFKEEFNATAAGTFGSGWAWLVKNGDALDITSTKDADLPLAHGQHALLTVDVWEHAYYIDYRNSRPDYLNAFWQLVNWDFVNENLSA